MSLQNISLQKKAQAGVHWGHQTSKWNPKMEPYIYGEKNGFHIIDLVQTCIQLKQVNQILTDTAQQGKSCLFVGTRKEISPLIEKIALESNSFYVNQRWLGGLLTNWKTIQSSIKKLNKIELQEKRGELFKDLSKKETALAKKEKERLEKYLGGVKNMLFLPSIVIIVGQPEEMKAVQECRKLGIPSITLLDTNCNPSLADLFITTNDDSVASVEYILTQFSNAILTGKKKRQKQFLKDREKTRKKTTSFKKGTSLTLASSMVSTNQRPKRTNSTKPDKK
uniref:Small ribosomal subunit protein uS2c n=1 Tax=Scotinosphaera sp. NIES-154 TaxID=2249731 RepID=A0A2Z4MAA2_9CHLO|nr:ribosomal protein S2 [Scotinosphaera sp. NIES-154]